MARRRPARPQQARPKPTLKTKILFAAMALYLGANLGRLVLQEGNLCKQARELDAERVTVVAESQELTKAIARAKTNAGIERLAREELGLVDAQEVPVKTVLSPPTPQRPTRHVGLPPGMAALARINKTHRTLTKLHWIRLGHRCWPPTQWPV